MGDTAVMSWDQIKDSQRSKRAKEYRAYRDRLDEIVNSDDPKVKTLRANFAKEIKNLSSGEVHTSGVLTNFAVKYANEDFIGESMIPKVPVAKKTNTFRTFDKRDVTGAPDDSVAEEGEATRIVKGRGSATYTCVNHALRDFVSDELLKNQDEVLNEMLSATETVADQLALNRELRQASLLTTAANYSGNTGAAGTAWSASGTLGGDPIGDVLTAVSNTWRGPGPSRMVGFTSMAGYIVLARHPDLLSLFQYTNGGLVTPSMISNVFGLDELYIGKGWQDTANITQAESNSRIWGNVFGVLRVSSSANARNASFAKRFEFMAPSTTVRHDPMKGVSGGTDVKVGNSDVDQVVAPLSGWLITGIIT